MLKVQREWELYLRSPSHQPDVKSRRLDVFLSEIQDYLTGCDTPEFINMQSVSSILSGEFHEGVLKVCSKTQGQEGATELQKYLLQGRGAVILEVINTIGVNGMSSGCELAEMLLSILPLCLKFPLAENKTNGNWCLPEISESFNLKKTDHPEKRSSSKYPQLTELSTRQRKLTKEATPVKQNTSAWGSFLATTLKTAIGSASKDDKPLGFSEKAYIPSIEDDSTDSEGAMYVDQMKTSLPPNAHKLGVFRGVLSPETSDIDDRTELDDALIKPSDELVSLKERNLDPIYLCHMILNIITVICQDSSSSNALGSSQHMALSLLPQLGQLLSLIQDELENNTELSQGWSPVDYINIQRLLFRLILAAMFRLNLQRNGVVLLQRTGIMQALVSWGHSHRESVEEDLSLPHDVLKAKHDLCSDLNEGIFGFMEASLKHIAVNPSAISTLLFMLKDYAVDFGLESCLELISQDNSAGCNTDNDDQRVKTSKSISVRLVEVISSLVSEMKKVKVSYIHTVKCSKKNHRSCDFSKWRHHHHDILATLFSSSPGSPSISSGACDTPSCMVAFLLDFLLNVLAKTQLKWLKLKLLSSLELCGLCCCMPPNVVIKRMICDIQEQSPSVRNYVLTLLCRFLLEQNGGLKMDGNMCLQENRVQCKVCEMSSRDLGSSSSKSDLPDSSWTDSCHDSNLHTMSDSAFSSGENTFHFECHSSKWACVKEFKPLLFDNDTLLSVQTMQHILKLLYQGNQSLQTQLYHAIVYPVLVSLPFSDKKSEQNGQVSDKIINYCLNGLPLLLQIKAVMSHFINTGGIKRLCHLLTDSTHRTATCKVFQIMVLVEEMLMESCSETPVNEYTEGTSQNSVDIKEKNIVTQTFLYLLESFGLVNSEQQQGSDGRRRRSSFLEAETQLLASEHMKSSPEITSDLWICASVLLRHSSHFRRQFADSQCPGLTYTHLVKCLEFLKSCEGEGVETKLFDIMDRDTDFSCKVALLYATVSACLTCQDNGLISAAKDMDRPELIKRVKEHVLCSKLFRQSAERAAGFKVVCDLLLSLAVRKMSPPNLMYSHLFSIMHLKLDTESSDRELQEVTESSSSRDTETITEQGYEADSEVTYDDIKSKRKHGGEELPSQTRGNPPLVHMLGGLVYPEFCRLVLELVLEHRKLHNCPGLVSHVLLKLITLAKVSPHNASILYNQGLVELLLTGLRSVLTTKEVQYQAERRLALDLFLIISRHSFLAKELTLYLRLMNEKEAPLDLLLNTLIYLAKGFQLQPSFILCFPTIHSIQASDLKLVSRSLSQETLSVSMQVMVPSNTDGSLSSTHTLDTVEHGSVCADPPSPSLSVAQLSPQHCAPVQLKLSSTTMWPGTNKGFSVALWLRVEDLRGKEQRDSVYSRQRRDQRKAHLTSLDVIAKEKPLPPRLRAELKKQQSLRYWSDQCLHVFSVGNTDLMFEVWLEPNSYSLVYRLVTQRTGSVEVLVEGASGHVFEAKKWQHLTLTFSEALHADRTLANVCTIVDGCFARDHSMEYSSGGLGGCSSQSSLYLGHSLTPEQCNFTPGTWQMGNIMVFKDCPLTKHTSFHLYTLGPNACSLSHCDCSEQSALYSHYITEQSLVYSGLSHHIFTGNHTVYLQHLRDNMIAVYSPRTLTLFQQYEHKALSTAANTFLGRVSANKYESCLEDLIQQPTISEAVLLSDLAPQQHRGLRSAVEEIGGSGVFLFLTAKLLGQESSECEQADSVRLLFTYLYNSPEHYQQFSYMGGYAMLAKLLSTSRCKLGYHLLKVLLDACLTSPVMHYRKAEDSFILNTKTEAIIRNTCIIEDILLAWKVWERTDTQVWSMAVECLAMLVKPGHRHRDFNVAQLEQIRIIERMTMICLERLQEGHPPLPIRICESMLYVIQNVVEFSAGAAIHHMITMWDFLLLLHPAASAFVFHSPADLYFKNKAGHRDGKKTLTASSSFGISVKMDYYTESTETPSVYEKQGVTYKDVNTGLQGTDSEPLHSDFSDLSITERTTKQICEIPLAEEVEEDALSTNTDHMISDLDDRLIDAEEPLTNKVTDNMDNSSLFIKKSVEDKLPGLLLDEDKDIDDSKCVISSKMDIDSATHSDSKNSANATSSLPIFINPDTLPKGRHGLTQSASFPSAVKESTLLERMNRFTEKLNMNKDGPFSSPKHRKNAMNERSRSALKHSASVDCSSQTSEDDFVRYGVREQEESEKVNVDMKNEETESLDDGDEGLYILCAGVADLLASVLGKLLPEDLPKVLSFVIKPEIILVLLNHPYQKARANLIKLLDMYLHRSSKDLVEAFIKMQGFHLLATQLHQHPASTEIVEACFTVMSGRPVTFMDELDVNMLADMTVVQKHAVIPLLALVQSSLPDIALCHNILTHLTKVFEVVSILTVELLDKGLCEVLCNLVHKLNTLPKHTNDLGGDETDLLWMDIEYFFEVIVQKTFRMSGLVYYQHLEDTLQMLIIADADAARTHRLGSVEHLKVKKLMCIALETVLHVVDEKMESPLSSLPGARSFTQKVGGFLSRLTSIKESEPASKPSTLTSSNTWDHTNSFEQKEVSASKQATKKSKPRASLPHIDLHQTPRIPLSKSAENPPLNSAEDPHSISNSNSSAKFDENPVLNSSEDPHSVSNSNSSTEFGRLVSQPAAAGAGVAPPVKWWSFFRNGPVEFGLDFWSLGVLGKKNAEISQADLLDRFKKVISLIVDVVLYSVPFPGATYLGNMEDSQLQRFPQTVLSFLLRGIVTSMERRSIIAPLFWQTKDTLRMQFSRLYTYMLSIGQSLEIKQFAVAILANELKCRDIVKLVANINYTGQKLEYYLYQLLLQHVGELTKAQREEVEELQRALQQHGYSPIRLGSKIETEKKCAMEEDIKTWQKEHGRERDLWKNRVYTARNRLFRKHDAISQKICQHAMEVTRVVNNAQTVERKKFLEHVKKQMAAGLQTKKAWQQLIQQLTHERAVWFDEQSYPKSWQLDPTEGPCRVRKRLQRCHLDIKAKFFKPEAAQKLSSDSTLAPLSFLFEDDSFGADSRALIYKLHTSQNIQFTCLCTSVTPSDGTSGALLVGQKELYFVADEAILDSHYTQVLLGNKDTLFMTLPHEEIREIHKRWYQLRDDALEIFMLNGKTLLLSFADTKERDDVYKKILSLELPNKLQMEDLPAIQQLWLDRKITNYEYLTHLNKLSGRSFTDLMQYPVMPFVLSQYTEDVLDLENPQSYRNLSKPIAVQDKSREQKYIDNYKWLEHESRNHQNATLTGGAAGGNYRPEPYHYGSHYSNSGSVLHFLVRLPPFTQMFLTYQDKNFDIPDRTFHSLATTWQLASFASTTDVKELIPEFFYFPEFMLNGEGFNFGVRQNGKAVDDISLPAWCCDNTYNFIKIHRQALESDYVTQHLASWIDLVFGYKQTGKAAIDAINVFHPATYFGVDVDKIANPLSRNAVKTMIATYGQTPKQLFKSQHPAPEKSKGGSKSKSQAGGLTSGKEPISTVVGLKWGTYVGSPSCGAPRLVWEQLHGSTVKTLVTLPSDHVFGLGACSCLLAMYSKEKGITAHKSLDVVWASIVSWGHPESVIRLKNRKDLQVNFLHWNAEEQVTCCACMPDCKQLFFGSSSGIISIFNTQFNHSKASHLQVFGEPVKLYGHRATVTALCLNKAFSVLVSISQDCTCIIWDLNRLIYVRCITDHGQSIVCVSVSDTLGDIATASHNDSGSTLMLHTINGSLISTLQCEELIHCLAYTSAPEGLAVNALAGGLSGGSIRLWSSWDLQVLCDIHHPELRMAIVGLAFSKDNQRLFASAQNGKVMCWERPGYPTREINFLPFLG